MLIRQVTITPASSGFGLYDATRHDHDLMEDTDVLSAASGCIYRLGSDALPDHIQDITGLIHNEPDAVLALDCDGYVTYFGFDYV